MNTDSTQINKQINSLALSVTGTGGQKNASDDILRPQDTKVTTDKVKNFTEQISGLKMFDPVNLSAPPGLRGLSAGDKNTKVPNLVHFVWITPSKRNILFTEMISILGAYKKQRPDKIYFTCVSQL